MSIVFNIAKGRVAAIVADEGPSLLVLLLTSSEADSVLEDYDTVADILAAPGNTEASDLSYARKTGITGTVTVNDTTDQVEISIPDQTWESLQGDSIVKAIVAFEDTASDAGRIPLTAYDWNISPDGSDVTLSISASAT